MILCRTDRRDLRRLKCSWERLSGKGEIIEAGGGARGGARGGAVGGRGVGGTSQSPGGAPVPVGAATARLRFRPFIVGGSQGFVFSGNEMGSPVAKEGTQICSGNWPPC